MQINTRLSLPYYAPLIISLAFIILGGLSACTPSLPLYLEVWDAGLPAAAKTPPSLLVQPFDASVVAAKPIGELYGWQNSQQIRVDQKALSSALTSKFERQLAEQGLSARRGSEWDGTLAGLKKLAPGYKAAIDGTIRVLRINSEKKGLYTVSRLRLIVECRIGLPGKQTVRTRQMEINQERTHILQQAAILEELLNQGLEETAMRLAAELKSVLSSAIPE